MRCTSDAHHIGFVEVNEGQAFHAMQNVHRFQQPAAACLANRSVLRRGNHRLELKSEAGDEHLHLL